MTGQYSAANAKHTRGVASDIHRNERIGYFEVKKNRDTGLWYLRVNEDRLIGSKYPSQKDALAVLHGLFTGMNASTSGMNAVISKMVTNGRGVVEADLVLYAAIVFSSLGWDAMLDMVGSTTTATDPAFNFSNSSLTVTRSGFNSSGAAISTDAVVALSHVVRQPYDSEQLPSEDFIDSTDNTPDADHFRTRISCDRPIFSGDTISGTLSPSFDAGDSSSYSLNVTNSSTLAAPKAIARWASYGDVELEASKTVDLVAYHASAKNGDQGIACVKFECFKNADAASYSDSVVSTLTLASDGLPVYRYTIDQTGLAANDKVYVRATVMPNWGPSRSSSRVTYGSMDWAVKSNEFHDLYFVYTPDTGTDVYVSTATSDPAGNDSNAGTSGAPFLTLEAAINSFSGVQEGNIYFSAGSHVVNIKHNVSTYYTNQVYALTIQPAYGVDDHAVIFTGGCLSDSAINAYWIAGKVLRFKDVAFNYNHASTDDALYGDGSSTYGYATLWGKSVADYDTVDQVFNSVILDNCTFESGTSHGGVDHIWNQLHNMRFVDCTVTTGDTGAGWTPGGNTGSTSNPKNTTLMRNVTTSSAYNPKRQVDCLLACTLYGRLEEATSYWGGETWASKELSNGIVAYNKILSSSLNLTVGFGVYSDFAFVCNEVSMWDTNSTPPLCSIYEGGQDSSTDNWLVWHNSFDGQRTNMFYADDAAQLSKVCSNISIIGNVFAANYIKTDTFGTGDGNRVGNWSVTNQIGCRYNISYDDAVDFDYDFNRDFYTDTNNTPSIVVDPNYPSTVLGSSDLNLETNWATTTGWTISDAWKVISYDLERHPTPQFLAPGAYSGYVHGVASGTQLQSFYWTAGSDPKKMDSSGMSRILTTDVLSVYDIDGRTVDDGLLWKNDATPLAQIRMANGSESTAAGAGADALYQFDTGSLCGDWWDNFRVVVYLDSDGSGWGSSVFDQSPPGGSSQPSYLNCNGNLGQLIAEGDKIRIDIYTV